MLEIRQTAKKYEVHFIKLIHYNKRNVTLIRSASIYHYHY